MREIQMWKGLAKVGSVRAFLFFQAKREAETAARKTSSNKGLEAWEWLTNKWHPTSS
jgi:hypothetical protein